MTQTDYEDEKVTICIKDVFADIFEELAPVADEKKVTLSLLCDDSVMDVNLDSLYRAFYNLVENAIKYNLDGGGVTVTVQEEPRNACLSKFRIPVSLFPMIAKRKYLNRFSVWINLAAVNWAEAVWGWLL